MDGEWQNWTYGTDLVRGWTLTCGRFTAEVRQTGGRGPYFLTINNHAIMNSPVLEEAQEYAEREIVLRVESVLPAFQIIRERVNARALVRSDRCS